MALVAAGDVIQLRSRRDRKAFHFRLEPGRRLETHKGIFEHDNVIGCSYGQEITSHLGESFFILRPSTDDLLRTIRRKSQIIFPKDVGFILLKLAIVPGKLVVEAGTGSGALTLAMAQAVGPQGHIVSYDVREDMQNLARRNLELENLTDRVTLKQRDIVEGFDETNVQSLFLDVPNPWDYLGVARAALGGGGHFGALVPTANQVIELLDGLNQEAFVYPEVLEILMRYYKTVPARMRPDDRMVGHTGYLVFARPVEFAHPKRAILDETDPDYESTNTDIDNER